MFVVTGLSTRVSLLVIDVGERQFPRHPTVQGPSTSPSVPLLPIHPTPDNGFVGSTGNGIVRPAVRFATSLGGLCGGRFSLQDIESAGGYSLGSRFCPAVPGYELALRRQSSQHFLHRRFHDPHCSLRVFSGATCWEVD